MSCTVAGGRPDSATAAKAASASRRVVPGCELLALAITGFPAAIAATKSPPATLLKAKGKLLGPNTHTGPIGASTERMLSLVSIVGSAHEPSSTAAAPCRSCPVVRGSSTSARRGERGRPVSACAMSTSSSLRASIREAKALRKAASLSGGVVRSSAAASTAACSAASQSAQSLIGYSPGSVSPRAGFSALKAPVECAGRHWPAMRMG